MNILLGNIPTEIPLENGTERYFVKAGSRWPFAGIKRREEQPQYIPFPFYLGFLAALLVREKFNVQVLDGYALNLTIDEFVNECLIHHPDILLFETTTPTVERDLQAVLKIKSECPSTLIIVTGAHATLEFKEILKEPTINYVIRGEYEATALELVKAISLDNLYPELPGLCYEKNDKEYFGEPELIADLNWLPLPEYRLFPSNQHADINVYWDGFCQKRPAIQMLSSRGCPFLCNFCLWNEVIYQHGKYRFFSAQRLVNDIEYIRDNFFVKEYYFDDDTFTGNRKKVHDFCDEIMKRNIKISWSAMCDFMGSDEDLIRHMARAGCIGIKFGVESSDATVLKNINKPINLDKIKRLTALCQDLGIKTHATFTFGLLGDTQQSMVQTLDFAKKLSTESVQFSINTPFPGTTYYKLLFRENRISFQDYTEFDGASNSVVDYVDLDRQDVLDIHNRAKSEWFRYQLKKPDWIWRQLKISVRILRGQGIIAFLRLVKQLFYYVFSNV
ncbi:MAG TPA: radical SAM protein [candidate division Zixibacteria bacterium]|nr:radical SAM protein [candidate division Zixibacteria bacterium]